MADTSIRYLTMLRMIPRYPRAVTTSKLAEDLEGSNHFLPFSGATYSVVR